MTPERDFVIKALADGRGPSRVTSAFGAEALRGESKVASGRAVCWRSRIQIDAETSQGLSPLIFP